MARNDPQVNLRMPADLKDQLDFAAEANKRSLTAEIVARLQDYPRISLLEIALTRADQVQRELAAEIETLRQESRENFGRANVYEKRLMVAEAEQKRLAKENSNLQRTNENFSKLIQSAAGLSDRLADAEERAAKFEKLMHQARHRLGIMRDERNALERFVRQINDGYERTFMGPEKIDQMTDRELLLHLYYDVARLNAEMIFERRPYIEKQFEQLTGAKLSDEEAASDGQID